MTADALDVPEDAQDANPRDQLPQDLGAEQSVLGAMMLSRSACEAVERLVSGTDFYRPRHEVIFDAAMEMFGRGEPVDAVTLGGALFRSGDLSRIGGAPYLAKLQAYPPSPASAGYYARIVRERAILRRLVMAGTKITQLGYATDGGDPDVILAAARTEVDGIQSVGRTSSGISVGDAAREWIADFDNPTSDEGWEWPWRDLNDILLPARRGQLVVFGARPKIGKSTALVDCIRHFAFRHKAPSVFFSLEMPRSEVVERVLSAETGIPLTSIREKRCTPAQRDRLEWAIERLEEAPLEIFNEEATLPDIRAAIRQHGAEIVGYDYLQLTPVGQVRDAGQRGTLIGQFAQGLKSLALAENVLILTAAQLNRGPEQRQDKKPTLADFRESGAIEQALDVAVMLHRPECYNPDDRAGECDLIVVAQRNGPTGARVVASQLHRARFANAGEHS